MRKTLASLVAAASLFASIPAFADELKVGDKMPEPKGREIYGGLGEYIKPKDDVLRQYLGAGVFPAFFKTMTKFYFKKNPANPFDFKIKIYYPGSEEVFKTIVLLSDQKVPGRFNFYASCSDRGEIDLMRENFAFDPNNSAGLVNISELSCLSFTISDTFKRNHLSEPDSVTILNPGGN
ncbi:hypothetical protein HY449_01715 [Candidatus Pacearchaeota archaeon]|nr:hypothetical protein [Candidatus Pacearchaeota archaeon]